MLTINSIRNISFIPIESNIINKVMNYHHKNAHQEVHSTDADPQQRWLSVAHETSIPITRHLLPACPSKHVLILCSTKLREPPNRIHVTSV